ncbi:MAG TPA: hypothetical protein VN633_10840, partial [Bryobacteraceae bacterium]|nr:hypothetical protein [Bryobacteraceae bacterium]
YTLRFVARENGEGKVGTFQTAFTVPALDAEKIPHLSSLILSNQIQPVTDQLAGVKNSKKLIAEDPLVGTNGQKIVPNVTRVFRPDQMLYAFLQLYDPTTPEGAPANFKIASVQSILSLYSGDAKVFETQPVTLRRFNAKQANTMDVRFQTALQNIKPGRYTCQVTVIDELGRKFAFPRASIVVVSGQPG